MLLQVLPVMVASFLGAITEVAILQHRFEPDTVRIQPGDTVRWTHADATAHTVTGNGVEIWDSGYLAYGDVYVRAFPAVGAFDYVCLYHPMSGKVYVGGATAIYPDLMTPEARAADKPPRDLRGRATTHKTHKTQIRFKD